MISIDDTRLDEPARRGRPWVKGLLVTICLLIAAMWVYAFLFATKKAAYRVDDAAWRERAQEICVVAEEARLELVDTAEGYIADPTEAQMLERADLVDRATDILEDELEAIVSVRPTSERDQALVDDYEGFYRSLIADRRAYTAHLHAFDLQPYRETAVDGGPVTNVLTDFAIVNEMRACAPPDELGGDR